MQHNKSNKLFIILIAVVIISGVVVFFSLENLGRSPFASTLEIDEPVIAVQNEAGYTAVLDDAGYRIIILSPAKKITALISYNSLSANTPVSAENISMDGEHIYILDHIMSSSGTYAAGDRILVYSLNGKFEKILMTSDSVSEDEASEDGRAYRFMSIFNAQGRVYATLSDELDEEYVSVADVTDGTLQVIHEFQTESASNAYYRAESDSTIVITQKGSLLIWDGDELTGTWQCEEKSKIADAYICPDGSMIALDINANTLGIYDITSEDPANALAPVRIIDETGAKHFSVSGNTVIFADPDTYEIRWLDIETGSKTVVDSPAYSAGTVILGYLTWIMAALGAAALVLLAALVIMRIVKNKKSREEAEEDTHKELTNGRLYGPLFGIMALAFAVTAILLGSFYYSYARDKARANVTNAAYSMRENSRYGLGDAVSEVDSQADYGSEAYLKIEDITASACMTGLDVTGSVNLSCGVYRFLDDGNVMVIQDPSGYEQFGNILTPAEQECKCISESLEYVKNGIMAQNIMTYTGGITLYEVYAPIYDSQGEVVGAVVPAMNETVVYGQITEELMAKILEVFTLLAGFTILVAEIIYVFRIFRVKKANKRAGLANVTVVESERTLLILYKLPFATFLLFCTLMASEIMQNVGLDSAFLLALPMTLISLSYSLASLATGTTLKYHPRKYMCLFFGIEGLTACVTIIALVANSFVLFCVCSVIIGAASGAVRVAIKSIQHSGRQPGEEFRQMVYTGVESPIGTAIGAAIGAVVREMFGNMALLLFLLITCIFGIVAARCFVRTDIDAPKVKKARVSVSDLSKCLKFYFRPGILGILMCGVLPTAFILYVRPFVLPIFNEDAGYSDTLIGTITLAVQLIIIFVMPVLVRKISVSRLGNNTWVGIFSALMAVLFMAFGLEGTMKSFIPLLLVIEVAYTMNEVLVTSSNVEEAGKAGLNPNDTFTGINLVSNIGTYLGTMVLSLMLLSGYAFLGYAWAVICAVCAVAAFALGKVAERKENK